MGSVTKLRTKTEGQKFKTIQIYRFRDGDTKTSIAYQTGNRAGHRLCLVDGFGDEVAAGYSAPYELPCFATFGTYRFMAVTEYFEGEVIQPQAVYRLEEGTFLGSSRDEIEEDGEDPSDEDDSEPESEPEEKPDDGPWKGWYIHEVVAEEYGNDLVRLAVEMRCTNDDSNDIEETLDPPFERINSVRFEEYGGEGSGQQSIVVIVEGEDGSEANIQVEIDQETGRFKEESLHGWETID